MRDENIQAFEQYLRRRSPDRRTPVDYISDVRQFAAVCSKPWREVTMHDIDAFVDGQLQAGLAVATTNRRVAALKAFFDFMAEEAGDLNWPNPVRSQRHAGKKPKRLPRDLHNNDIERLWDVIIAATRRFALAWRRFARRDRRPRSVISSPAYGHAAGARAGVWQRPWRRVVLVSADAMRCSRPGCKPAQPLKNPVFLKAGRPRRLTALMAAARLRRAG
jgi:integrase